jgi:hypothetical protein
MPGLVLSICLLVSQAFAQEDTGRIRGVVRQRGAVDPLGGMPVTCAQQVDGEWIGVETTTDPDGHFACDDLSPGTWTVFVEADGFRTFETTEEVIAATGLEVVYSVERRSNNPYDVEVRADKPQKEVVRHELTAEDAENLAGTFGDIAAAVQTLPGVARQSSFDGDLIVRGTDWDNTPILLAGSNLVTFYHYGNLRSIVPTRMIDSVEFYPGNAPAQYGRTLGGILQVNPVQLDVRRFGGEVDVNLLDAGAYLEAPIGKKASIAIAGRRSYVDAFLGLVDTGDGGVSYTTAPRYSDAELLFTWRPSTAHTINLMGLTAADALAIEFANPQEISPGGRLTGVDAAFTIHQGLLQYDFRPSDKFSNEAFVGAGYQTQDIVVGTDQYVHLKGPSLYARDLATLRVAPRLELRAGGDFELVEYDVHMDVPPPLTTGAFDGYREDADSIPLTTVFDDINTGGFVDATWEPVDGLTLIPGVRGDWSHRVDMFWIDPRFTTRLQLSKRVALSAGVGRYSQMPALAEIAEPFGSPVGLEPEHALQTSAGAVLKPTEYLSIEPTVFYNDLDNLVSGTDAVIVIDGEPVAQRYDNSGIGRSYGFELLVRHDLNKNLSGWLSYTLSRAERQMSGETDLRLHENDQTHILQAVGAYRLPARFDLSSRVRYVTGNPTTPVDDAVFVSDQDEFAPIPGVYNSDRLPEFFQLDVRLARTWLFRTWELETYLDVQNVTNRKNTEQIAYSYDYTEKGPATGLPILPALGVKASW